MLGVRPLAAKLTGRQTTVENYAATNL